MAKAKAAPKAEKTAPVSSLRHPRAGSQLVGQEVAEQQLLQAWHSSRMPHAWLISGPKGIGKATLAYRLARFILSNGKRDATSLAIDRDDPVSRRVELGSHSDLMVLESPDGSDITIDETRKVAEFLSLTPAESQWRVVIIDPADALNRNSANALLKTLEEPPRQSILILVSHNPGMLLPTIRSRCRVLKLPPLSTDGFRSVVREQALTTSSEDFDAYFQLSGGSAGVALFLLEQEALALYHALLAIFTSGFPIDGTKVHALAGQLSGKQDSARFDAMQLVLQYMFHQLVAYSQMGEGLGGAELLEGEGSVLKMIAKGKSPAAWLQLWEEASALLHDTRRIYLDRKQVLMNIILAVQPKGSLTV